MQTGTLVSNLFPMYTATIVMNVDGSVTADSTLAAAGSNFNSTAAQICSPAGFTGRGDVGIKVLGGADPSAGADGTVSVNFDDFTWGLGDTVTAPEFDFKSTLMHELLHAIGFSHSVTQTGTDACAQSAPTAGGWVRCQLCS